MTKKVLIAGLDEAGRGPCFGPMVMGLAVIEKEEEDVLKEIGATDSKLLTEKQRDSMVEPLKNALHSFELDVIQADQLDDEMAVRSLNEIEAMHGAALLNKLKTKPDIVYVDSPDGYADRFAERMKKYLTFKPTIMAEHKADLNYVIVGAASVLAKVERDRHLEILRKKYGEIGSGYSHDPYTRKFLTEYVQTHKKLPPFARKAWATSKEALAALFQQKLF